LRYFSIVVFFAWLIGFPVALFWTVPKGALRNLPGGWDIAVMILFFVAFLGGAACCSFLWLYRVHYRGMRRFLPAAVDLAMRCAAGVPEWGVVTMPVMVGDLGEDEPFISLEVKSTE
jgi:hypothetical protein